MGRETRGTAGLAPRDLLREQTQGRTRYTSSTRPVNHTRPGRWGSARAAGGKSQSGGDGASLCTSVPKVYQAHSVSSEQRDPALTSPSRPRWHGHVCSEPEVEEGNLGPWVSILGGAKELR